MGRGTELIYNIMTLVFIVLTAGAIAFFALQLSAPPEPSPDELAEIPTVAVLPTVTPEPTLTPSNTPRPTLPPTFTPTPTASTTPSPTLTPTATITDTPTITFTPRATDTATITPVPSNTPGPSPTVPPTVSPFLFGIERPVQYTTNTNVTGCNWQGIGGNVTGLDGQPYSITLQVHAFNDVIDITRPTGSNSFYGPISGYEMRLADNPAPQQVFVQLESVNGVQVSERVQLRFPGNCGENLATVNFVQLRAP
jgi:hypothetical protein